MCFILPSETQYFTFIYLHCQGIATVHAFMQAYAMYLSRRIKSWKKYAKKLKKIFFKAGLTWAGFDTGGSEAVLSMWVRNQLVQVGVVTQKAWARVLTHAVILEVPTGLQHKQASSSTPGPKQSPTLMITLHSSITALAQSKELYREAEQTLLFKALPSERSNQQLHISLVLKPIKKFWSWKQMPQSEWALHLVGRVHFQCCLHLFLSHAFQPEWKRRHWSACPAAQLWTGM